MCYSGLPVTFSLLIHYTILCRKVLYSLWLSTPFSMYTSVNGMHSAPSLLLCNNPTANHTLAIWGNFHMHRKLKLTKFQSQIALILIQQYLLFAIHSVLSMILLAGFG